MSSDLMDNLIFFCQSSVFTEMVTELWRSGVSAVLSFHCAETGTAICIRIDSDRNRPEEQQKRKQSVIANSTFSLLDLFMEEISMRLVFAKLLPSRTNTAKVFLYSLYTVCSAALQ